MRLFEGAVHYLDILADFAGAKCDTIYAQTWNPGWSEFRGDPQALVMMHFENGTRALLEATAANAVGLYPWTQEYFRAECERATLVLNHRKLERFFYKPSEQGSTKREGEGEKIPLMEQRKWGHAWLREVRAMAPGW